MVTSRRGKAGGRGGVQRGGSSGYDRGVERQGQVVTTRLLMVHDRRKGTKTIQNARRPLYGRTIKSYTLTTMSHAHTTSSHAPKNLSDLHSGAHSKVHYKPVRHTSLSLRSRVWTCGVLLGSCPSTHKHICGAHVM